MQKTRIGLILMGLVLALQPAWAGRKKNGHPDYTRGDKPKENSYWAMGPTGIIGYTWNGNRTRQILIKEVQRNTPADGRLREQDVILGLGGGTFTSDARAALSRAITEAEKKANGGTLTLNIWRPKTKLEKIVYKRKGKTMPDEWAKKHGKPLHRHVPVKPVTGKTMQVTLTLPVLGTYSGTAPWDCPKTRVIIDKAAAYLLKQDLGGGIPGSLNALGLLATGEKKYLPKVRAYAHKIGGPKSKVHHSPWHGSYRLVFLTEYYLATKDEYVLPYINKQAVMFAKGISGVGTYSHCLANWKKNGLYGPPGAYGAMNQCSETCALSLVLAQKCGVKDKLVDEAVRRALNFLRYYIEKGTIPYGDHMPNMKHHDNNGRNSQAAVLFDLAGDKEAANYFTRMTLASWTVREIGHTGPFWSWQWGALGAARGGPKAANSFIENIRYFTELERRANGGSVHQGRDGTRGWNTTGSRLLQHCLPRKKLYITGKGGSCIEPITGDDLKTVVAAARFDPQKLSVKQLLSALGNWSLIVRSRAAEELGKRKENVVTELINMLHSPDRYTRYGACIGLKYAGRGSKDAVKALVRKVAAGETRTMQFYAILGLQKIGRRAKNGLGKTVKIAAPALLKLANEFDRKQDPYGKLNQQIIGTLFYAGRVGGYKGYFPNGKGIETQDPDLVVGAMKAWLTNPNGGCRTTATRAYDDLKEQQISRMWPEVYYAAKNPAPSGVMFAGGGQANSTILLARYRFKEGLPLAIDYLKKDGWGKFGRVPAAFDALSNYGSAVKKYMKVMQKEHKAYQKRKPREVKNCNEKWAKVMKNIDKDFDLRSIEEYLKKEGMKK